VTLPESGKAKRIDDQTSKPIRIVGPKSHFQMNFSPFHQASPGHIDTAITNPPLPKPKPQIPK
jgi:hypothetical protein